MEVYVYGTGCGAGDLIDRALPAERVRAFVEEAEAGGRFLGRPVIAPEELAGRTVDLLIVTGRDAEAVAARCRALGIGEDRLLFLKNHVVLTDRNRSYERAEAVLGRAFTESLKRQETLIRVPRWGGSDELADGDFVRVKTLEALCRRLDGVPGAAAELGAFRGDFARCLNALLPERPLYLFDTFTGFDEGESAGLGAGFVGAHRQTALERVLARLPHPERALPRPGLFPHSAEGLEERFALVSLDVDLEESTLAGLRWFWPRLEPGGYLLLHDWLNPDLPGPAAALRRYETESGERLRGVPLCDINGSLVLCR